MSFPRYPAYKDSSVDWLGNVPEHWGVDRLKNVISIKKNIVGADSGEFKLLSLTLKGVIPRDLDNPQGKFPTDFDGYQAVQPNDLIFCLFDVEETPRAVGIARETGMVTGAYTVGEVKAGHCSDFIHYFYLSRDQYKALKMYYTGLRNVIRKENFYDIPCPLPPPIEQQKIAAFLDRETAKIDALVAEQEQLITLLKEKRQAVISHAVTKGLDPSVPMKDSGVEWLGEVPAHWEIKKVSLVFRARKGSNAAALTKEYCATIEGEYPVYSGQTENAGVMASISSYEFDAHEAGVLFSTTVGAKAMTIMHIFGKFSLSQNCMIIAPIVALHVRFFFYHMQPLFQYERGLIPEHMQASFRMEDLYAYRIASPNFDEQISIAKFLDERCAAFDALIDEAEKNVSLLKERRSSIISAAVTGQIDVRGLAPAQEQAA